jgi:hypothetical protein
MPTLPSFIAPFVPSEFLSAHQQFSEAIIFAVKSIASVIKPLSI